MDASRFDTLVKALTAGQGNRRRAIAAGIASAILGAVGLPDSAAKKKKHKHKRKKKKCAKAGKATSKKRKKCCKGLVRDGAGRCATCDVCARGCRYAAVQAAIDDASGPSTIAICAGSYPGNFSMTRDLTLVGMGDGSGAGNTILSAAPPGTSGDDIVTVAAGRTVRLERLRISGGSATGQRGIFNQGRLTLAECTVTGNVATEIDGEFRGGGIYNSGGTLTLDASHLINNGAADPSGFAYGVGGGMYNEASGTVTVRNGSTVADNTASHIGGGISNYGALTLLDDSRVSGNSAFAFGGGINNAGTLTLVASEVTGNTAGQGGGIYHGVGILTLLNGSTISGNTATFPAPSGGGVYNDHATVDAIGGSITGNTPDDCVENGGTGCPP